MQGNPLFDMLAGHAATSVFSAKLYSESERKLTTIQSFLDLLSARLGFRVDALRSSPRVDRGHR